MALNIGIDVGGTFTDCVATDAEGAVRNFKTPTTHFDLSVGFMKGMQGLARQSGEDVGTYMGAVESLRYSTTVGTNAVIERTGPKLGLITTSGFEDTIFLGRGRSWADGLSPPEMRDMARVQKPPPLISPNMVVGLGERIDSFGNVLKPLTREEIMAKLQGLVDRGAMGFVVCLLWSFVNPVHEQLVKEVIEEEYPEDYLGSMPVVLSSEISPKAGEYTRTMTAIVNAYIHGVMADEMTKLGNELRDSGYDKPLVLVHNTGGTKKVSRTRAVLTHNAGPVAGMHAAALVGAAENNDNIIFTDMGGTSFDIGVIAKGEIKAHDFIPVIDRWRTNIPAIEVKSIGAGGGSIAWVNEAFGKALEVGPQSAGSMPGPACYDQGGTLPTVTDADLLLGYYNPDNYLGGDMLLDVDISREVIEEHIAAPLGIDAMEAAYRIRRVVDARMGQEVFNEVALKGHDPRKFALFACGGAGAAHGCNVAQHIGVNRVVVPLASSVFGALGAATMPIREVWEKSTTLKIFQWASQSYLEDADVFNAVVRELILLATRDLRLEGYEDSQMHFKLEVDMRFGSQYNLTKITAPRLEMSGADDFKELADQFTATYAEIYSPESVFPQGGVNIENFFLTASVDPPAFTLPEGETGDSEPSASAKTGSRQVYWQPDEGLVETPVYALSELQAGNQIDGRAIIEAVDTTFVVPGGWRFSLDGRRTATMENLAAIAATAEASK